MHGSNKRIHRFMRLLAALSIATFAAGVSPKKFRIFLVGQTVSGNVFRFQRYGPIETRLPLDGSLPRQAEHEIDADILKTGGAEQMKRMFGLGGIMLPA